MDEVRDFFNFLNFTPYEGIYPEIGRKFYTISYDKSFGRHSDVIFYTSSNLVENIEISPEIIKQKTGSPRDWIAYSPETLIMKFGKPSRVQFYIGSGMGPEIMMIMYFDGPDLISRYYGNTDIPGKPPSLRFCPLTYPFNLVRLWLGPNPPNSPTSGDVPLEKATSLTIDQFSKLMLGDPQQACFTLNEDATVH